MSGCAAWGLRTRRSDVGSRIRQTVYGMRRSSKAILPGVSGQRWTWLAVALAVFGPLSLDGESLREDHSSPQTLARLIELPGSRVAAADTEGRGTLVLTFENNAVLRIIEDGDAYECFTLLLDGREIIV